MSRNEGLRVSLAVHKIVMSVDQFTLEKIEPHLREIEDVVASHVDSEEVTERAAI